MELEAVIGLEIHAQLSTDSKLWCGCDNDAFGATPNSRVCPVCMGFPGVLPVLNKSALQKGLLAGAALKCKIQNFAKFDRKNYFYPDLPFGYQISQFDKPIAEKGHVDIEIDGKKQRIGITRVHLENDAGKLIHTKNGTQCDYNRAGTPLIEIVTDPDIRSATEAQIFAKEVQKILRYIDSSDADMEKGMMRFDASISLRPKGSNELNPRAEIKNLNSFMSLKKALDYEISRQKILYENGQSLKSEITVSWKDDKGVTEIMRDKESAADYRYFPEPDLPPITLTDDEIKEIENKIPELPLMKKKRYKKEYKLATEAILTLTEDKNLANFFEAAVENGGNADKISNLILSVLLGENDWLKSKITAENISEIAQIWAEDRISASNAKKLVLEAMKTDKSINELIDELKLEQVSDTGAIEEIVQKILDANPKIVAEFLSGKDKVLGFLVGQVMKESSGSANPQMVNKIIREKIKN